MAVVVVFLSINRLVKREEHKNNKRFKVVLRKGTWPDQRNTFQMCTKGKAHLCYIVTNNAATTRLVVDGKKVYQVFMEI